MIVGIGIDLVDIARVERLVRAKGDRALRRLFTESEVAYAMAHADPNRHLAARIAAKEAAYKALAGSAQARGIGWRELEVVSGSDGRPSLKLHGAAEICARALAVTTSWIALSHSAVAATALVIFERGDSPPSAL